MPLGIGVALYLVEYGKRVEFAHAVRYFIDVMTGVPSIVFGLFIYIVLVRHRRSAAAFAGWKGSIALALLMLPVVTRSAEVVLLLVPDSLREAALALGAPRWRVDLPGRPADGAARASSPARCSPSPARAGETAPLLFTAVVVNGTTFNLERADELAARADLQRRRASRNDALVERAWGAALTLVAHGPAS